MTDGVEDALEMRYRHYRGKIEGLTLMSDLLAFHCKKAGDMYSKVLADCVHRLKETEEGVEELCEEMEKIYRAGEKIGRAEGLEQGRQEGKKAGKKAGKKQGEAKKARDVAVRLAARGFSNEEIARTVQFSVERVARWLA